MSPVDEITKATGAIRVKITWRAGNVKHEAEFDGDAIEVKRDSYRTDRQLWSLTMVERPRWKNSEEIVATPAPTPPVPATCCGHEEDSLARFIRLHP